MPVRRRSVRRRRWATVGLATAVAGAAVVVWVGFSASPTTPSPTTSTSTSSSSSSTTTSAPSSPTTTSTPPSSTGVPGPTAEEAARIGSYQVGTTSLAIVEPGPDPASSRSLPTSVWYPASSAPSGAAVQYPLLVFSQGFDLAVQSYSTLLSDLASAGFVVAAPTYPDTDPGPELNENDIVNHPADLRFVITTLLGQSEQKGSPLAGIVDTGEVGVLGHSDGGDVSLAVAANPCCRDSRVKAAAILSGAELASFGGSYFSGPEVPLLVIQGSADTVNVPVCSTQLYDAASPPKYYLDLLGAEHEPPYIDPGPDLRIVAQVTADFFSAQLDGQAPAARALAGDGDVPGVALLTVDAAVPQAPGSCAGAPG